MSEVATLPALVEPTVGLHIFYDMFNLDDVQSDELVHKEGKRLREYLDGLPMDANWMVFVNGEEYQLDDPLDMNMVLDANDRIGLFLIPTGGDGFKSVLRIVVMAAAVAIAATTGQWYVAAAVMAAAGVVNTFLLTPRQSMADNGEQEKTYGIDGAKNTATENIPVPVIYGEYRQAGNIVDFYTENSGNTQYIYMRAVIADGRISSMDQIELNEQPIENYDDAQYRITLGEQNQEVNNWFGRSIRQNNINAKLTGSYTSFVTSGEVDRARFDFLFPRGLVDIDEKKGKYRSRSVDFIIEYREVGKPTWEDLDSPVGEVETYPDYPPQVHELPGGSSPVGGVGGLGVQLAMNAQQLAALQGEEFVDVEYARAGSGNWNPWQRVPVSTFYEDGAANTSPDGFGGNTWHHANLPAKEIPDDPDGVYDIRVSAGASIARTTAFRWAGRFRVTDRRTAQIRKSYETSDLPRGVYEFRVRRATAESTSEYIQDEAYLVDVAEIENEGVALVGTATLSIRIKLTDQLNNIPNTTARVRGSVVKIYDAEGNVVEEAWTNNRAWICTDMLCGDDRGVGYNPGRVDWRAFHSWANHCEANNWAYNGIFDSDSNLYDAMREVMTGGYAAPINLGTKLSVAVDVPREPVQAFTSANMIEGTWALSYLGTTERANEYEVTYYDALDRNKAKTIRYVDPRAVQQGQVKRRFSADMRGMDNPHQAAEYLWRQYYSNRLLIRQGTFDAYIDAISATIGDVVLLQSNRMLWSDGGLLKQDGGQRTAYLDQPVEWDEGKSYTLIVQHDAVKLAEVQISAKVGQRITVPSLGTEKPSRAIIGGVDYRIVAITPGVTSTVSLEGDLSSVVAGQTVQFWTTDLVEERSVLNVTQEADGYSKVETAGAQFAIATEKHARFIFGETEKVMRPFTVLGIDGEGVERRTLSVIEYHEGVYAPPETELDIPITQITDRKVPQVQQVRVDYDTTAKLNQQSVHARVRWSAGTGSTYGGADVYRRVNGADWEVVGSVPNLSELAFMVNVSDEIDVRVVAFDVRGNRALVSGAPTYRVTIQPGQVAGTPYEQYYSDGSPIDELQPAEGGADVTGNNTAKDTDQVGGVPSADVIDAVSDENGVVTPTREQIADITAGIDAGIEAAQQKADDAAAAVASARTDLDQARADLNAEIELARQNENAISETVTTAQESADGAYAKIEEEKLLLIEADEALAAQIETVESGVRATIAERVPNDYFENGAEGWTDLEAAVDYAGPVEGHSNVIRTKPGSSVSPVLGRKVYIASDDQRFKLDISLRCIAGSGSVIYAGAVYYDADDQLVAATDGTGNYPLFFDYFLPSNSVWHTRTATIGRDVVPATANGGGRTTLPAGAVYFRPCLFFNYGNDTTSVIEWDYFTVREITEDYKTNARITTTATTLAAATEAVADRSDILEAQMGGTTSSVIGSRATAAVNAAGAVADRTDTLETQMAGTSSSGLKTQITSVSDATQGLVSRADILDAKFAGTSGSGLKTLIVDTDARVGREETARASETGALARRADFVEASAAAGGTSLNANPTFAVWPEASPFPTGWLAWASAGVVARYPKAFGRGSDGVGFTITAGASNGGLRLPDVYVTNGYYVMEAEVWIGSGTLRGAGLTLGGQPGLFLDFYNDPDVNGVTGAAVSGGVRRFSKLVKSNYTGTGDLHIMNNWGGFPVAPADKDICWLRASIRPATDGEIKAQKAFETDIPALSGRIDDEATVAATATGVVATRVSKVETGLVQALDFDSEMDLDKPVADLWRTPLGGAPVPLSLAGKEIAWSNDSNLVSNANQRAELFYHKSFPVDPSRKYKMSARFGSYANGTTGRNSLFYIGFVGCDANGVPVSHGSYGTYRYAVTGGGRNVPDGQQVEMSAIVSGEGNDSWVKFPPGTKRIIPMIFTNYDIADIRSYIDYFRIEEDALSARVQTTEAAVTNLQGKTVASWKLDVAAGSGRSTISAVADGQTGLIGIDADEVDIAGVLALKKAGQSAQFLGKLAASVGIGIGTGDDVWPVALQSRDFYASDGGVINFGRNVGGVPSYDISVLGLAPLAAGEAYNLTLTNVSATGATARLKISTPGASTQVSLSNDTAGTPTRQIDKGGNPDSSDGVYSVRVVADANWSQSTQGGFSEALIYIILWAKKNNVWQQVATRSEYVFSTGQIGAHTTSHEFTYSIQMGTGVQAFGFTAQNDSSFLDSVIAVDLANVSWTAPGAQGGERSATPSGQKAKVTIRPQ